MPCRSSRVHRPLLPLLCLVTAAALAACCGGAALPHAKLHSPLDVRQLPNGLRPEGVAASGASGFALPRAKLHTPLDVRHLPNGLRPEGVAADGADGFFSCGLGGDVVHTDASGVATQVAYEPRTPLTGVKYDPSQHALFVAGSTSGQGFVYELAPGSATRVARRFVVRLGGGYINDVALGATRVFFSDSMKPIVHSIPRHFLRDGAGQPAATRHALPHSFACAGLCANGLAEAEPGVLLVAHYLRGELWRLDTTSGAASKVALPPHWAFIDGHRPMPDGLVLAPDGPHSSSKQLWIADNFHNRLVRLDLSPDWRRATIGCVATTGAAAGARFATPSTLAVQGDALFAVNAHFLDCLFIKPCTWQTYEIVGVPFEQLC